MLQLATLSPFVGVTQKIFHLQEQGYPSYAMIIGCH